MLRLRGDSSDKNELGGPSNEGDGQEVAQDDEGDGQEATQRREVANASKQLKDAAIQVGPSDLTPRLRGVCSTGSERKTPSNDGESHLQAVCQRWRTLAEPPPGATERRTGEWACKYTVIYNLHYVYSPFHLQMGQCQGQDQEYPAQGGPYFLVWRP